MDEIKEHIQNGIKHAVTSSAQSTANAAFITEEQRQVLVRKQEEFLGLKGEKLTEEFVQRQLGYAAVEVHQAHLKQLKTIYQPINSTSDFFAEQRIRFFDITRWVADPEEKGADKLVNVYHVLSGEECSIALIYHRSGESCRVTLAVANLDEKNSDPTYVEMLCSRMEKALHGNFPGARTEKDENGELLKGDPLRAVMQPTNETPSVAIVSNIPSEKSVDFVSQSMEKLLDGIVPQTASEEYTLVLLANPLQDHLARENRLCQLHSALTPYASYQQNYGYSENTGQTGSANIGASTGIGVGVGVSAGVTAHVDINFGLQFSRQSSVSAQVGKNESFTQNYANYGVKHTQDLIEKQIKRIEESSALGMWEFAAYVISEDPVIANNVAHMLRRIFTQVVDHVADSATLSMPVRDFVIQRELLDKRPRPVQFLNRHTGAGCCPCVQKHMEFLTAPLGQILQFREKRVVYLQGFGGEISQRIFLACHDAAFLSKQHFKPLEKIVILIAHVSPSVSDGVCVVYPTTAGAIAPDFWLCYAHIVSDGWPQVNQIRLR